MQENLLGKIKGNDGFFLFDTANKLRLVCPLFSDTTAAVWLQGGAVACSAQSRTRNPLSCGGFFVHPTNSINYIILKVKLSVVIPRPVQSFFFFYFLDHGIDVTILFSFPSLRNRTESSVTFILNRVHPLLLTAQNL